MFLCSKTHAFLFSCVFYGHILYVLVLEVLRAGSICSLRSRSFYIILPLTAFVFTKFLLLFFLWAEMVQLYAPYVQFLTVSLAARKLRRRWTKAKKKKNMRKSKTVLAHLMAVIYYRCVAFLRSLRRRCWKLSSCPNNK